MAARTNLADLKEHLEEIGVLAEKSPHLVRLKENLPQAKQGVADYEHLAEETVTQNTQLEKLRMAMDKAAENYMQNCADFLASQILTMEREITEQIAPDRLRERLVKINLVNEIINIGNTARVGNFKSQATRDPEELKQTIENLGAVEKKFDMLKAITHQEEDQRRIANTRQAAANYELLKKEAIVNFVLWEALCCEKKLPAID